MIVKEYALTLRDIEYLLRQLTLICRTTSSTSFQNLSPIFILFLTIRTHKPDLYKKCCNHEVSPRELMKPFNDFVINSPKTKEQFTTTLYIIEGILLCLLETNPPKHIDEYSILKQNITEKHPKYAISERVTYVYNKLNTNPDFKLKNITERIELTRPFVF